MKHTPHGYWLEEAGECVASAAARGRPPRRRRRDRRRLHRDVGGLAPEGDGAGGPGRRCSRPIDLRPWAERPQRRLLQRDVVLAAEHAGALGRRGRAGGGGSIEGGDRGRRGVLRVAGRRRLVPPRRLPAGLDRPRPGRHLERDRRGLPRGRRRGRGRAARPRRGRRALPLAGLSRRRLLSRLGDASSPPGSRAACATACAPAGVEVHEASPVREPARGRRTASRRGPTAASSGPVPRWLRSAAPRPDAAGRCGIG